MTITPEILAAFVDGELPPSEMRHVEAEIANNPDLRSYVEQQLALRREIHDAFDVVLEAPLPERLLATAERPDKGRKSAAELLQGWLARHALAWSGIAALTALVLGLGVGLAVTGSRNANIFPENNGLIARGALETALNTQMTAQRQQAQLAKIGISFRNKTGSYCRTFQIGGTEPQAGVACHQGGAWRIALLTQTTTDAGANAPYQPAASGMPDVVRSAITDMISGTPLNAADERTALAAGWKSK